MLYCTCVHRSNFLHDWTGLGEPRVISSYWVYGKGSESKGERDTGQGIKGLL